MKNLAEIVEGEDIVTKDYVISQTPELEATYTASTKNLTINLAVVSSGDNTEY